jgi:hypothetical protein
MLFRLMLSLPLLLLADGEDASGDDTDATDRRDGDDGDSPDDALGDKGRDALRKEREARRKAEADAKDLKARLDKIDADARKEAEKRAAEQGKWEELAGQREADLTETTTKLQTAETELASLRAYVTADVAEVAKAIKEAAKTNGAAKVLLDVHPGDDASTAALLAWAEKAKAQLPEMTEREPVRGNGAGPKVHDGTRNLTAALQAAKANPKYSI